MNTSRVLTGFRIQIDWMFLFDFSNSKISHRSHISKFIKELWFFSRWYFYLLMSWKYLRFWFGEDIFLLLMPCFKHRFRHQKKSHTASELNDFWFEEKWTCTRKYIHLENAGNAIQVLWVDGSSYFSQIIIHLPTATQTFANCNIQPKHLAHWE